MAYYVDEHIKNLPSASLRAGNSYDFLRYPDMSRNPERLPTWFVEEVKSPILPDVGHLRARPLPHEVRRPTWASPATSASLHQRHRSGHPLPAADLLRPGPRRRHRHLLPEMYWVNCNILGLPRAVAYNEGISFNIQREPYRRHHPQHRRGGAAEPQQPRGIRRLFPRGRHRRHRAAG